MKIQSLFHDMTMRLLASLTPGPSRLVTWAELVRLERLRCRVLDVCESLADRGYDYSLGEGQLVVSGPDVYYARHDRPERYTITLCSTVLAGDRWRRMQFSGYTLTAALDAAESKIEEMIARTAPDLAA